MKRFVLTLTAIIILLSVFLLRPVEPTALSPELASSQSSRVPDPAVTETKSKYPEPMVIVENGERISVPPKEVEPEAHVKPSDLDWEDRPWDKPVDAILATAQPARQKIDALIKLLETMPREGQVQISHEIVGLSAGGFDDVITTLLLKSKQETVTSVFLTEMLKRSDKKRLPVLLALAQQESHPNQVEAVELLELLLEEQHSNDWAGWQTAINKAIASH
jgi:hypothetical protein